MESSDHFANLGKWTGIIAYTKAKYLLYHRLVSLLLQYPKRLRAERPFEKHRHLIRMSKKEK